MESSIPSRLCPYCEQEKPWIFSGKKLKDGSKIYTDAFSCRWAGKRCPDCERHRVHAAVKCDSFTRDLVVQQLEEAGYTIACKTLPLIASKDGKTYTVGIRQAHAGPGKVLLDRAPKEAADVYALVFTSVRILTAAQIRSLEPAALPYPGPLLRPKQQPRRNEEKQHLP